MVDHSEPELDWQSEERIDLLWEDTVNLVNTVMTETASLADVIQELSQNILTIYSLDQTPQYLLESPELDMDFLRQRLFIINSSVELLFNFINSIELKEDEAKSVIELLRIAAERFCQITEITYHPFSEDHINPVYNLDCANIFTNTAWLFLAVTTELKLTNSQELLTLAERLILISIDLYCSSETAMIMDSASTPQMDTILIAELKLAAQACRAQSRIIKGEILLDSEIENFNHIAESLARTLDEITKQPRFDHNYIRRVAQGYSILARVYYYSLQFSVAVNYAQDALSYYSFLGNNTLSAVDKGRMKSLKDILENSGEGGELVVTEL